MPYAPEGNPETAKYVIVAEAPAREEMLRGQPLVGHSGRLFDQCIGNAGLSRRSFYITNVFDQMVIKPKKGDKIFATEDGKTVTDCLWSNGFTDKGMVHVDRVRAEIRECNANVVVALGEIAMNALTGKRKITKHRGSVWPGISIGGKKVIPTIHPAASLHGQYTWRYMITYDFQRAKKESEFDEIRRPGYQFTLVPTYRDACSYLKFIKSKGEPFAFDIEIIGRECSRISFATTDVRCISIGFNDYTHEEEIELWLLIADILEDESLPKIVQNGMFDMSFLFSQNNIHVKGEIWDTMVMQHIMYPDFPKGLDFLTSIYTDQPYYKDMVKVKAGEIDKADG